MEVLIYAFGAAGSIWIAGFGSGLVVGFIRRLRDAS